MIEKPADRFWWGMGLACAGIPIFFGGVFWKWIRLRIGAAIAARVDYFTTDPREAAIFFIVVLIILPFVSKSIGTWVGGAVAGLLIFLLNWRYYKRPGSSNSATVTAKGSSDDQTHIDLIHLLNCALNQSTLVRLGRLIELACSPQVTDAFKNGENSIEAQQSRQFYIDYVGREIAGNFDRRQRYLGILANAETEVDRRLDDTEDQRSAGETLAAFRRRQILELQFTRAIQFLQHERREIEEMMSGQVSRLAERLHRRQEGSIGG